jgi:hypothetical protein
MLRPTLTSTLTPGDAVHAPCVSRSIDTTAGWTAPPGSTRRSRPTTARADMQLIPSPAVREPPQITGEERGRRPPGRRTILQRPRRSTQRPGPSTAVYVPFGTRPRTKPNPPDLDDARRAGTTRRWQLVAPASMRCMTTIKPVPVRITPELVARIDALRGLVPREPYVRDLLDKALKAEERKAAKR